MTNKNCFFVQITLPLFMIIYTLGQFFIISQLSKWDQFSIMSLRILLQKFSNLFDLPVSFIQNKIFQVFQRYHFFSQCLKKSAWSSCYNVTIFSSKHFKLMSDIRSTIKALCPKIGVTGKFSCLFHYLHR